MNPVGIVLALGTVGVLWWLSTQNKGPKFFSAVDGVAYWPAGNSSGVQAETVLQNMTATPVAGQERVWSVAVPASGSPTPTALTTVLLIRQRGNLAVVPKNILSVPPGGSALIAEVLPAEAKQLVPASQDDIGVLPAQA